MAGLQAGTLSKKRKREDKYGARDTDIEVGTKDMDMEDKDTDMKDIENKDINIKVNKDKDKDRKSRYIVFVGNLPYSATAESVRRHFSALHPVSVRCLNRRDDPTKCRGIAFVEFANPHHMKTALEKFHHTTFDDGTSPARKINTELTAGGGGRKPNRAQKIKTKNARLNEQRWRRSQAGLDQRQKVKG